MLAPIVSPRPRLFQLGGLPGAPAIHSRPDRAAATASGPGAAASSPAGPIALRPQ